MTTTSPKPQASALDASVVICAYTEDRWDDLLEAIESVCGQTPAPAQITVVIDHNDALLKRAKDRFAEDALVTVIGNRHQNGLSGARNTGIEVCLGDIVVFLDDDAVAQPGWLFALTAPYADSRVAGTGGRINPRWLQDRPAWWPPEFDWVVGCSYTGLPTEQADVRNPIGASMSVRRSAFDTVGGFSPSIGRVGRHPVGCEETELFIRIRQHWADARVVYEPAAVVEHKVPAARGTFDYFRRRCYAEGLSKAIVSKLVGAGDGLSSERSYVARTLPLGVLKGLQSCLQKRNIAGAQRAGSIVAGLALTTAGYLRGRLAKGPERLLVAVPHHDQTA